MTHCIQQWEYPKPERKMEILGLFTPFTGYITPRNQSASKFARDQRTKEIESKDRRSVERSKRKTVKGPEETAWKVIIDTQGTTFTAIGSGFM
jgi:hypothetical protein